MKNDILNSCSTELRKMPFEVPEGYFQQAKEDIRSNVTGRSRAGIWGKAAPYISIAAAFMIMVTAGTFILEKTSGSDSMTYEDYLVHSDMLISAEYDNEEYQLADASVADEDIVEYLIYIGVTAEDLENSKE